MADALSYPDLPQEMALDAAQLHHQRAREAARRRVRATMPPIPEMRFEQAYLRSLMPALRGEKDVKAEIAGGREVAVVWKSAAWITLRDQVGGSVDGSKGSGEDSGRGDGVARRGADEPGDEPADEPADEPGGRACRRACGRRKGREEEGDSRWES
jgi:hypothetical protein